MQTIHTYSTHFFGDTLTMVIDLLAGLQASVR